jgi:hypothetical protein
MHENVAWLNGPWDHNPPPLDNWISNDNAEINNKQGQRKAWLIPSPNKSDPVTLTFDLENQ